MINKGIFCFLNKHGLSIHEMRRIIFLYALSIQIKRPKKSRLEWYSEISNLAQKDFLNFKKIFNQNKNIKQKTLSYDEFYEECNLNGYFAYNGVADNF